MQFKSSVTDRSDERLKERVADIFDVLHVASVVTRVIDREGTHWWRSGLVGEAPAIEAL